MAEASLYERLGGAFAIAAVIEHFSDAVVRNPIAARNRRTPSFGNGARTIRTGFPA
jgi:hemoglobin